MSDINENKDKNETDSEAKVEAQIKGETKEEVKGEVKEAKIPDTVFISDSDRFEVSLKFYVKNHQHFVEGVDDDVVSFNELESLSDPSKFLDIVGERKEDSLELDKETLDEAKKELIRQGIDIYDESNPNMQTLKVSFKYPSQQDHEIITGTYNSKTEISIADINNLEVTRLIVLIRDWNIDADITRLTELDPKIIKGLVEKVRDVLGVQSII